MHRLCQRYGLEWPADLLRYIAILMKCWTPTFDSPKGLLSLVRAANFYDGCWGQDRRRRGGWDDRKVTRKTRPWIVRNREQIGRSERTQLSGCCCYDMMSFVAGGNSRSVKIAFIAQFTPEVYQTEGGWWWWITPLLWDSAKKILNTSWSY